MNSRISNREKIKGEKKRESKREKNTYQVYIYIYRDSSEFYQYIKRKREKELRKLEIKKTKERKTETYAVKTKV